MSGIEFKILDVGCGGQPKGDVNCDLFFGDSPHVKNFVRCDAQYLPFKNNSFKIVYSSHVIEHLPCPLLALREWNRVSRSYVYIRLPYAFRFFDKHHLYGWNKNILENLLSKVFSKAEVYSTTELHGRLQKGLLKKFLDFIVSKVIPFELVAVCRKS